eukprot:5685018-Prymnesium_polylepis.1
MALGGKQFEEKTDFFLLTDLPWAILQGGGWRSSWRMQRNEANAEKRLRNPSKTPKKPQEAPKNHILPVWFYNCQGFGYLVDHHDESDRGR